MSILKIRTFPDTVLRKKAAKVTGLSAQDKATLKDMAETMYLNSGVGLAAVQVGIDKQLAVVDIGSGLIKMVNPVIIKKEGAVLNEEGCLSVPGACINVKRARFIQVSFMNESGEVVQLRAEGLLGRAIQHEIDHLSGFLIIDYLNPVKKFLVKIKSCRKKLDKTPVI